jgi:hypothetical protein
MTKYDTSGGFESRYMMSLTGVTTTCMQQEHKILAAYRIHRKHRINFISCRVAEAVLLVSMMMLGELSLLMHAIQTVHKYH